MATTSYGTPYVQSSDLVSGWPTASLNVANRIDAVSYAGNGLNAQTGTTYTLVVGDAGKTVTLSNAAAVAVTLPQDSVANLPTGAVVNFYNLGAGTVTISAGAGATLQGGSLTAAQYGNAAVIKLSANTYGPSQSVPITPALTIITPTSITNSGGTATATNGSVSFTTVNSVSLNGVFTSTIDNYIVEIVNSSSAGTGSGEVINFRYRAAGTDATTAYVTQRIYAYGSTLAAVNSSTTNHFLGAMGNTELGSASLSIYGPNLASHTRYLAISSYPDSTTATQLNLSAGALRNTTQYDGITFYPPTGTITGTVRVYGYRNS